MQIKYKKILIIKMKNLNAVIILVDIGIEGAGDGLGVWVVGGLGLSVGQRRLLLPVLIVLGDVGGGGGGRGQEEEAEEEELWP